MNLFLLTSPGHIVHAQDLIRQYGLKDCDLVIIHGKNAIGSAEVTEKMVDHSLFRSVVVQEIPFRGMYTHLGNYLSQAISIWKLKRTYSDILAKYEPKKIFLCCYNSHYTVLYNLARKQNIDLVLYEEGISTYSLILKDESLDQVSTSKDGFYRLKKIWKSGDSFVGKLFLTPIVVLSEILRIVFQGNLKKLYTFFLPEEGRDFFGVKLDWNDLYVVFPRVAQKIFHVKGKINNLQIAHGLSHTMAQNLSKQLKATNINAYDAIFLNQNYDLPSDIHIEAVLSLLEGLIKKDSLTRMLIKLHPKETNEVKKMFKDQIQKKQILVDVFESSEYPVEVMIQEGSFKNVYSIASSSIVYAASMFKNIKFVSVAGAYIEKLEQMPNFLNKDRLVKRLEFHTDRLKLFQEETNIDFI